ncbi:MAG: PKD domain-containing protein, partial [Bacteroidetes bacterium]
VIPTYAWDFGDGGSSTNPNTTHSYVSGGVKNTRLIVNVDGCRDTAVKQVSISNARTVTFTKVYNTDSTSYVFTASDPNFARFEWNFGDGSNRTSTIPSVTNVFPLAGKYTVTLFAIDSNGCSATFSEEVTVHKTVGVKNSTLESRVSFNVYPNPFTGSTNIAFELSSNEVVAVQVYDLLGRKVYEEPARTLSSGKHIININESKFNASSSAYMIRLNLGGEVISRQIIKE